MADPRRFKALSMVPPLADEVARQIEAAAAGGEGVREIAEDALATADQAVIDAANAQATADQAYDLGIALSTAFGGEITRIDGEVDAIRVENVSLRNSLTYVTQLAGGYSPLIPLIDRIGMWIDFTDKSTLWQDVSKKKRVINDGDPIGLVEDKSGNGFHFTADENINRPIWRKGVSGTVGMARFDPGTNPSNAQYLIGQRLDLTAGQGEVTMFALCAFRGVAGDRSIVTHSTPGGTGSTYRLSFMARGGRVFLSFRLNDSTVRQPSMYLTSGFNYEAGELAVLEGKIDTTAGEAVAYANGRSTADGVSSVPLGATFPEANETASYISSPSNRLDGDVVALLEVQGVLTDQEREGVYQYFRNLSAEVEDNELVSYSPNGPMHVAFFWFNSPNVINVGTDEYLVGGIDPAGTVMTGHYDFTTTPETIQKSVLYTHIGTDDHNVPAFATLPDGNVMAVYSKHNRDGGVWLSKTVTPGDFSNWAAPVDIGPQVWSDPTHDFLVAYSFLFRHTGEADRLYFVHREGDRTLAGEDSILTQEYWAISWSDDDGVTWTSANKLWGPQRPYTRVASNGVDRLDFFINDSHPSADSTNRIHHVYMTGGNFYKSDGTLIGNMSALPLDLNTETTLVFDANAATVGNSFIWDLVIDEVTGFPVGTYVNFNSDYTANTYWQARWNGSAWVLNEVVPVGAPLSPDMLIYAGGIIQDPSNVNRVYASIMVDSDGAITTDRDIGVYQIFMLETSDSGATWTRTQLTDEPKYAFRPVLSPDGNRLFYTTGDYGPHYTRYFTEVKSVFVG